MKVTHFTAFHQKKYNVACKFDTMELEEIEHLVLMAVYLIPLLKIPL